MSQQNIDDENQIEVIEPEPNQNQVAVAGAIAPNGAPQPEVFKLDTDCWDEIFDCLSLKDVHSFGQTCKAFQRVTGEYFQWKYEAVPVLWNENGAFISGNRVDGFIEFAQKIRFLMKFSSAESNFESVKQVTFTNVNLHQLEMNSMNLLIKVEHLELLGCKLDGNILEALIESCVNLKRLEILDNTTFIWSILNHPTLQHLALYGNITFGNDRLTIFLENSPSVRSLQITSGLLWENRDSILNSNIELDDLAIVWTPDLNIDILGLLADLHERGIYRRLHLKSSELQQPDGLLGLQGLVTLYFLHGKNIELPPLINVRELGFYVDWNKERTNGVETIVLASRFVNLERLFIARVNFNTLLPFIRRSINLKYVDVCQFEGEVLDISALNKERKKLEGARKVIIYVDEAVYLATKWVKAETSVGLIEIKRKESHDIVRPHHFCRLFRGTHIF